MVAHETHMVVKQMPVFTTMLYNYESINEKLISIIDEHQKLNVTGLKQNTNVDAWRTEFYTREDTRDFDFLIDIILSLIHI